MHSEVPLWLKNCNTTNHITAVLQVLSKRERAREIARHTSRVRPDPSTFQRIANTIPLLSKLAKQPEQLEFYSACVGYQPENKSANRYMDLEPYDRTRVIIKDEAKIGDGKGDKDVSDPAVGRYLNANWVRELYGGKWWIAAQAPLPNTAHAFLSILLQSDSRPPVSLQPRETDRPLKSRVRTVVQLTRDVEGGRRKAHPYFPTNVGQSSIVPPEESNPALPPIKITLQASEEIKEAHCVKSTIYISRVNNSGAQQDEKPIAFKHLAYTAWPDHGVPEEEDRASLLVFLRLVDQTNKDTSQHPQSDSDATLDPDPPIIVGCSAGIGRTGAFIALSSLFRSNSLLSQPSQQVASTPPSFPPSPLGKLPQELDEDNVAQEIDSLREQRPSMVQRDEQIVLIYQALLEGFVG